MSPTIFLTSLSTNCYAENYILTGNVTLTQNGPSSNPNEDFLRAIVLVLVPIGAGYVVTRYSTKAWQDRKDEISRSQMIVATVLKDYDESFKKQRVLLDSFADKVYETYLVYDDPNKERVPSKAYTKPKLNVYAYLNFPKAGVKQPSKLFAEDYKKFQTSIDSCIYTANHLYSNLRMFYDNSDQIIKRLDALIDNLIDGSILLGRILNCETAEDLENYYNMYQKVSEDIKNGTGVFEKKFLEDGLLRPNTKKERKQAS